MPSNITQHYSQLQHGVLPARQRATKKQGSAVPTNKVARFQQRQRVTKDQGSALPKTRVARYQIQRATARQQSQRSALHYKICNEMATTPGSAFPTLPATHSALPQFQQRPGKYLINLIILKWFFPLLCCTSHLKIKPYVQIFY